MEYETLINYITVWKSNIKCVNLLLEAGIYMWKTLTNMLRIYS